MVYVRIFHFLLHSFQNFVLRLELEGEEGKQSEINKKTNLERRGRTTMQVVMGGIGKEEETVSSCPSSSHKGDPSPYKQTCQTHRA